MPTALKGDYRALQVPLLLEREEPAAGDNEVVDDWDAHEIPHGHRSPGESKVVVRRLRIPGRMVVRKDEARG